jgi:hypothetical protein
MLKSTVYILLTFISLLIRYLGWYRFSFLQNVVHGSTAVAALSMVAAVLMFPVH